MVDFGFAAYQFNRVRELGSCSSSDVDKTSTSTTLEISSILDVVLRVSLR
jgi:hypothetical protein